MLLWDTAGNPPLQAGGTWGVSEGVFKGGLSRPYITIPVDPWWFNNEPFEGFSSRAAQIMTQGKIGKDRGRSHFLIFTTMFSFDILPKYHANHNRWQEERYWQR